MSAGKRERLSPSVSALALAVSMGKGPRALSVPTEVSHPFQLISQL